MICPKCKKEMKEEKDHHTCKKCGVKINKELNDWLK